MAKCEYRSRFPYIYTCDLTALKNVDKDGKKYCIFHCRREDKDAEEFFKGFKELYVSGDHKFNGFFFPVDFSFPRLRRETNPKEGLKFMNADFSEAHFLCNVDFSIAEFLGEKGTDFSGARFSGECCTIFSWAKFSSSDWTIFNFAEFSGDGDVKFKGNTFSNENKAKFIDVSFERPEKVTFDGVDLNRCRFLGTDISEIKFREVFWVNQTYIDKDAFREVVEKDDDFNQISFPNSWDFRKVWEKIKTSFENIFKRIEIFDEEFLRGKEYDVGNHYRVQQLYNQLRVNYERSGRYHEAGDFFVGAMEMRRKGTREKWVIRKLLTFYKCISLYGERPLRAFLWLIATPFLFLPFYFFNSVTTRPGIDPVNTINYNLAYSPATPTFWSDLSDTLYFSISNIWLGRTFTDLIPENGWTILFSIIENITGVALISLFILAMNRKFRRTKD